MQIRIRARCLLLAAAAAAGFVGSAASALSTITFDVGGGGSPTVMNGLGTVSPPVSGVQNWQLNAPTSVKGVLINSWTISFTQDPYVTNNINVTNTSGSTQTFIATVLLGIPAFSYDKVVSSSVGVTVTDSNGDNMMSFARSGSTAIYQGTVNGSTVLTLNPPKVPLTTANCSPFPNTAGCSATDSDGIASQPAGPGNATQIGITLTFDLSPGDSAGLTSRFEIVPEPATAALLAMGLLGLVIAGHRR